MSNRALTRLVGNATKLTSGGVYSYGSKKKIYFTFMSTCLMKSRGLAQLLLS